MTPAEMEEAEAQMVEIVRKLYRPYYYAWGNNSKRAAMKGRRCRVVARGVMNSILIEFEDGEQCVTSRNAIRKAKS